MEIKREENEKEIKFTINGSLTGTVHSAMHFFESITLEFDKCTRPISIDMKKVLFVDSMAIGLIIGMMLKAKEKKVTVKLVNVPELVEKVFESANLKKVFPDLY